MFFYSKYYKFQQNICAFYCQHLYGTLIAPIVCTVCWCCLRQLSLYLVQIWHHHKKKLCWNCILWRTNLKLNTKAKKIPLYIFNALLPLFFLQDLMYIFVVINRLEVQFGNCKTVILANNQYSETLTNKFWLKLILNSKL